jgi:plasmid stabilization system protein ParE
MIVLRTQAGAPIRWQCSVCDDEGVISNWEDSAFDLRRRQLTLAEPVSEYLIPDEVAAALRALQLLDTDCERLVYRTRAHNDHAILAATDGDLDELIGFVAAEANSEANRRRQQRLDAAFDALNAAARTPGG